MQMNKKDYEGRLGCIVKSGSCINSAENASPFAICSVCWLGLYYNYNVCLVEGLLKDQQNVCNFGNFGGRKSIQQTRTCTD